MLPIPERLRDANHSKEVVDYSHWNAHSIFFLDPAGNVVEYIARHDLKNGSAGEFGTQDLLYISEIGLIVDDVIATASSLKPAVGVEQYRGGDEHFTALGDECGLLLIMKRGRILNFDPSTDEKAARVFQTSVKVRSQEDPHTTSIPSPIKSSSIQITPPVDGPAREGTSAGGFFCGLGAKFLRGDAVPAFERAVECRGLGVSQQISDFADGDFAVLQIASGGLASGGVDQVLKTGAGGGEAALK